MMSICLSKQEIWKDYALITGFAGSGTGVSSEATNDASLGEVETVIVAVVQMIKLMLRVVKHLLKVTQLLNCGARIWIQLQT